MGKKRLAFSLIELMISLIVVSAITAAFTPILSKKIKSNTISVGNKQCTVNDCPKDKGVIKSDECKLCDACDKDELVCLMCNEGKKPGCAVNIRECYCQSCTDVKDIDDKNSSNCNECDWQPSNGLSCTGCKVGYYLKEVETKFLGNDVTINRCKTCEKGNYCPDGKKPKKCPEGYYCPNEGTTDFDGTNPPTKCPPGHYCPEGMAEPTKCPAGTASNVEKATSSSTCKDCLEGTYSAAGAASCTNCPAGTASNARKATSSSTCKDCLAGTYSAAGAASCTKCPKGTYQDKKGQASCKNCPAKTYSDKTGATSSSTCKNCNSSVLTCNPTDGECTSCPSGYTCTGKTCVLACKSLGSACSNDSDCCSGYCGLSWVSTSSSGDGGGGSYRGTFYEPDWWSNKPGALTGAGFIMTCQTKSSGSSSGGGGGGSYRGTFYEPDWWS